MLQLTSRRFLRELDEAPGGNNLQYILKCPCIPFFGNQGLHNEIMLGGNGGPLWGHVRGVPLQNLENAKEAIEEFEKEYQQDMKDIRKQKREEETFRKEELPGRFTAKKLFR